MDFERYLTDVLYDYEIRTELEIQGYASSLEIFTQSHER